MDRVSIRLFDMSVLVVAVCLPLIGMSMAMPQPHLGSFNGRSTVTNNIQQVASRVADPPLVQLAKAYARYADAVPAELSEAAARSLIAKRAATSVSIKNLQDYEYLCPVRIGSQTFNLIFDLELADLWVYKTVGNSQRYQPSTQGKQISGSWNLVYSDTSSVGGSLWQDTVVLSGLSVPNQTVQAATNVTSDIASDTYSDGSVGFAFRNANSASPQQPTIADNLLPTLSSPYFTVDLKKSAAGTFGIGSVDNSRYTGPLISRPVSANSFPYWGVDFTGYAIGSNPTVSYSIQNIILSTVMQYIALPKAIVQKYYSNVSGAAYNSNYGAWLFPCTATLPTFSFVYNGYTFTVPSTYLNLGQTGDSSGRCIGAILDNSAFYSNYIGLPFFRSFFVVFNLQNANIGIANKKSS